MLLMGKQWPTIIFFISMWELRAEKPRVRTLMFACMSVKVS